MISLEKAQQTERISKRHIKKYLQLIGDDPLTSIAYHLKTYCPFTTDECLAIYNDCVKQALKSRLEESDEWNRDAVLERYPEFFEDNHEKNIDQLELF